MFCLVVSCDSKKVLPTDKQGLEARKKIPCIIVLPVETKVNSERGITYQDAALLESGAAFMDQVLATVLIGHDHVRMINERQLMTLVPVDVNTRLSLISEIGSRIKCDAVLLTTLTRYRQRVGGSFGADVPAAASFTMKLLRTRDGSVVWSGRFDEEQESLLNNLMSFGKAQRRGFQWITVEELVSQGITEVVETCPYL